MLRKYIQSAYLLGTLAASVSALGAALLLNTVSLPSTQLAGVPAAWPLALPTDSVTAHLARALRIPTISRTAYAGTDSLPFDHLATYLRRTFPLCGYSASTTTACSTSGPALTQP
jgi:hypothetical protein